METIRFRIEGIEPLLLHNPQTVDPFNPYAVAKKKITSKRKKTDDDLLELRRLDVESGVYFDDAIGVYVPATWISAAIAGNSWARCKVKKAETRSAVFPVTPRIPLEYEGKNKVKELCDISGNKKFISTQLIKQGQNRIPKSGPIFHNWSFTTEINFQSNIIDYSTLIDLLTYAASYSGFGDFRPTYGRAKFVEIKD